MSDFNVADYSLTKEQLRVFNKNEQIDTDKNNSNLAKEEEKILIDALDVIADTMVDNNPLENIQTMSFDMTAESEQWERNARSVGQTIGVTLEGDPDY